MKLKPLYISILLVAAGSLVRLMYGLKHELWHLAPDQLAWELSLQELLTSGNWSYDKIIHYPHEGGSILISLFSLMFKSISSSYSLVISAFVLDALSRLVQLEVVRKVFGFKAFLAYALWSIFALPLLIPWGGLNFGLHALSAVFPFMLLLLINRPHLRPKDFILDGVFLGAAGWFMYSNFLLIIPYAVFFVGLKKWRELRYVLFSILPILSLHLLVRTVFDAGFHLNEFSSGSIRGEEFELSNWSVYHNLYLVWIEVFKEISIIGDFGWIDASSIRLIWYLCSITGIGLTVYYVFKKSLSPVALIGLLAVVVYVSAYAVSPFYLSAPTWSNYVNSRHFTYILPLFMALALVGLSQAKKTWIIAVLILGISVNSFVIAHQKDAFDTVLWKPAGWVLATKYGHEPQKVVRVLSVQPQEAEETWQGVGWGTSTNIFQGFKSNEQSEEESVKRVNRLIELTLTYPREKQPQIIEGILYSFSEQVTPILDSTILQERIKPQLEIIQEAHAE